MHWYTCKCLLNTLGRSVERLAGWLGASPRSSPEVKVQQSCNAARILIGASLSEPHTSESNGGFFIYIYTSVDAKHHGASLSERWNVTWVGNNSVCTH